MMSDKDQNSQATYNDVCAAKYLGVSVSWLRQRRCYGAIGNTIEAPKYIKIGRAVRYLKSDLDAWLEALPKYAHSAMVRQHSNKQQSVYEGDV